MKTSARKQQKKRRGSRGAVSIFLTIILVPCIIFTCIFGDLSRVQLSMATASSAGDLAMYSLLSHYDETLKEYYGLVASCQTIDEFYEETASYFTGMLQAEGVPEEGSKLFLAYLQEMREGNYSDFLRVDVSDLSVSAMENASLGENAALLEDGIVEFMKYRGPVEIVSGLLDRLSAMDVEKTVAEAEKNKQVVDKKQDYAEKQGDLLKTAFYIYLAIRNYEKAQQTSNNPSWDSYRSLETNLNYIRDDLKGVTSLVAKYYFPGTEELQVVQIPTFSLEEYYFAPEEVGTEVQAQDGTTHFCIDQATLADLLQEAQQEKETIQQAVDGFLSQVGGIPSPGGSTDEVVYCLQMQRALTNSNVLSTLTESGGALLTVYAKLEAAAQCEPYPENSDLPLDWKEQITRAGQEIQDLYDECLAENGNGAFRAKVNPYVTLAASVVPKVQGRQYTFNSQTCGATVTIDGFCAQVRSTVPEAAAWLQERIDQLNTAVEGGKISYGGGEKKVEPIDKLVDKAREFTNARNDWGTAAGQYDTDFAKQEYSLYQGAAEAASGGSGDQAVVDEIQGEKIAAKITPENVNQLKSRLTNIRSDLQACLDAINEFRYGGTAVKDFTSGEEMIQAARTVVPETTAATIREAEDAARSYVASLLSPAEEKVYQAPAQNNAADGNDPDLSRQTPELYRFLKQLLQEKEDGVEKAVDDNEKATKEYKEQQEKSQTTAETVDNALLENKGSDLEEGHRGKAVTLGSALGSLVGMFTDLTSGNADEIRDQLYVCEYIMDMFSYSTLDNEGRYRLDEDNPPAYNGSQFAFSPAVTQRWTKQDARDVMENQSLTNLPLTKENHRANLGEVEYILYGDLSIDQNLKSAYENIFAIREALNLVSGFCLFYGGSNKTGQTIGAIAAAIAGATSGIVPIPVTKCVLILALSTMESASDLQRLKAGGPVELYKSSADDWVCSVEGTTTGSFPLDNSKVKSSGLFYSDYMYLFLLTGLTNDGLYGPMLLRVGDLIQANIRLNPDKSEFQLSKAEVYFQLNGTIRVRPLLLTLPIVLNSAEGAQGLLERTDWCTYRIQIRRGYS